MAQVIIISNRLPISVKKENGELVFYPSLGGLATGLSSYVDNPRSRWIGWPGIANDDLSDDERQAIIKKLTAHHCYPIFLSQQQIDDFYNGYSNKVLWPLFHNLKRGSVASETRRRWWRAYRTVNEQYAQAALNLSETSLRLWIHDYQLLLVPELVRAGRKDINIGFFLHIPFPDAKTFSRLSEHKKLLHGMLGADLVGFHTPEYVRNFMENTGAAGVDLIGEQEVSADGHAVRIADFPMGIDYEKYSSASKSKAVKAAVRRYRQRYRRLKIIVSVDRLDPTKGLIERLQAYATLLERHPELRGKVVFSMVAAPSRTDIRAYQALAKRVEALVLNINKQYGTAKWQPVDYINVAQPFEEVTALFQVADVAFIAPLRDGMNLAAKEFVASTHKKGVLILSETAGAAGELQDALLVNPTQPETLIFALERALTMRKRELRRRLQRMQQQLSVNTVQDWASTFVTTLQQPVPLPGPRLLVRTMGGRLEANLVDDFRYAARRLLLLDYDGSLVPFAENYKTAGPPKTLLRLLETLSGDQGTDIVLVSGRSADDLEKWFGHLSINLIAEHGATIRKAGSKSWRLTAKTDDEWKQLLQPVLKKYAALTPGARVEVKPHSLVWHYRAAAPYYAQKYAVILKRTLRPALKKYQLELLQGNKVLEIKNPRITKGMAIQGWLQQAYPFILAIGDDATDEDVFAELPPQAYSIKVGRGRTLAQYRLPAPAAVIRLLRKLA